MSIKNLVAIISIIFFLNFFIDCASFNFFFFLLLLIYANMVFMKMLLFFSLICDCHRFRTSTVFKFASANGVCNSGLSCYFMGYFGLKMSFPQESSSPIALFYQLFIALLSFSIFKHHVR